MTVSNPKIWKIMASLLQQRGATSFQTLNNFEEQLVAISFMTLREINVASILRAFL
jgi:hypothetical protein